MIFDKFLRFDIHFPPIFTLFLGVSDNPIPPIPIPSDLISSYPYPLSLTLTILIRSIMDNIYMNNQFNLNDLRSDVASHLADQITSEPLIHHAFLMRRWCSITDLINPNKFEFLTNVMVAALIGSSAYGTLNFDSSATIQFIAKNPWTCNDPRCCCKW